MGEPFLLRALLAGLGLALVAAPLGCFVVWRRMAYYGETVAQAGLIGIAAGLALSLNLTLSVLIVTFAVSGLLRAARAASRSCRSIRCWGCSRTPRSPSA